MFAQNLTLPGHTLMATPIVAIVGRPNVGKSTLFNRILGVRKAIVHDEAGVTRDRHYGESDWAGHDFILIDTGGFVPDSDDVFERAIREQVALSIAEATVIVFMVDVKEGVLPIDEEIARMLRKSGKRVVLTTNKVDSEKHVGGGREFYALGLGEPFPVSAATGRNTGDLLDRIVEGFPLSVEREDPDRMQLAIIGRPNVGKSSITNALLGRDRSIVTDIAGTTRDSIDTVYPYFGREIVLIDTAGLRRRSKVRENLEFFSTLRTLKSIQRCDVALCLIDATAGLTHQDIDVFTEASGHHKGLVLGINKWDLVEKDDKTAKKFIDDIRDRIKMFDYVPIITLSAITKQRVYKALDMCLKVDEERKKRVPTSELNEVLLEILRKTPPPSTPTGREVKIRYITQVREAPPVIVFFTNEAKYIPESYRRFVERNIRAHFGFEGVPLVVQFRTGKPA